MQNLNYLHKLQDLRAELAKRFIDTGEQTGHDIDKINEEIEAIFNE